MDLNKKLDITEQQVIRARIHWDIFWLYKSKGSRDYYFETMDSYPNFYLLDEHAHFVSFIIYICKLFEKKRKNNKDKSKDSVSFCYLIEECQIIDIKIQNKISELLNKAEKISEKTKLIRDKAIAHTDTQLSYDDIFRQADVTYDELRNITEIALKLVNLFNHFHNRPEIDFHDLAVKDCRAILDKLKEHPRWI